MHINYNPFDASGLCNVEKISTGDCTCIIDTLCINNALSSAVTSLLFLKGGGGDKKKWGSVVLTRGL